MPLFDLLIYMKYKEDRYFPDNTAERKVVLQKVDLQKDLPFLILFFPISFSDVLNIAFFVSESISFSGYSLFMNLDIIFYLFCWRYFKTP